MRRLPSQLLLPAAPLLPPQLLLQAALSPALRLRVSLVLPSLLTSLLLASTALPVAATGAGGAEVGHTPPLFALPDEHGQVHSLDELLGRPIVLYFTHNMCHYCTQIIRFLKRAHAKYGDRLTIVTINVWADDAKFIRRYKEQFGLPFRMLAGKEPQLLRDYEVNYVPIIVFIGRDGRIRNIYHHYILKQDFEASMREIVEGD